MYGQGDIYSSPLSPAFGAVFADELDTYGVHGFDEFGEDDDEFGILGIALTRKARQKKWNKKLARTVGKLKKFHELGKMDKAQKKAKKLAKIVSKLEKVEEGFEPEPEVVAWMDFADTGDQAALEQALSATVWTGEAAPVAEAPPAEPGLVPISALGVRGGPPGRYVPPTRRRRLRPGHRPRGYGRWRPGAKRHWLSRHPSAASAPDPRDPSAAPRRGRRRGAPRRAPQPIRGRGRGAAFQAGRAVGGRAERRAGRRAERAAAPSERFPHRGRHAAFRIGRKAGRTGFGAIDEAVSELAEEMGAIPGTIGVEAFTALTPSGLVRGDILESTSIDDLLDAEDALGEEEEFGFFGAEPGPTEAAIQDVGPQFGAVFKRKTEKRLEGARKKYERLRETAVDPEDWDKVEGALRQYRKLAHAYKKAAVAPTPRKKEQALAALEEQPIFRSTAMARFLEAGGRARAGVPEGDLGEEEMVWSDLDLELDELEGV